MRGFRLDAQLQRVLGSPAVGLESLAVAMGRCGRPGARLRGPCLIIRPQLNQLGSSLQSEHTIQNDPSRQ